MRQALAREIASLSVEERLTILEELWDSLCSTPEAVPIPEAQRSELDRRLDALEADSDPGSPWSEVEARLRSSR